MDNKAFGRRLEERTREFAVSIIRLSTRLPNMSEARAIRSQLTRSAASVGANYREANRARSRADFKNNIAICGSEASETQYWLGITEAMQWLREADIRPASQECGELLAIFTSIGKR